MVEALSMVRGLALPLCSHVSAVLYMHAGLKLTSHAITNCRREGSSVGIDDTAWRKGVVLLCLGEVSRDNICCAIFQTYGEIKKPVGIVR